MATLGSFARMAVAERGLITVATLRANDTIQASLVNAGILAHPLTGRAVVGFVTYGQVKLANLQARPQVTVSVRSGGQWTTVEGSATLVGPDDPLVGIDAERRRLLLREVFIAAGGRHDDWDEYDRVMDKQRRTVVLVEAHRVYSN